MKTVEIFENQRAAGYNQFVQNWIPNYHYFMDQLPKLLRGTEDKNLLVAGCGTGAEIERFVEAEETWQITGVDPSPEMIAQAEELLQGHEKVTLLKGTVEDLKATPTFGAATLLLVLHFMEDDGTKLGMLRAIADRLKPGAPLVMLDITGSKQQIWDNLQILRGLLPDHISEEDIANRLHRIQHSLFAVSEERLAELLTQAGFEPPLRFFQTAIYMGWMTKKK